MENRSRTLKVIYLGLSGVVHPSASAYELVNGCAPWSWGHREYEAVSVLEVVLAAWPEAHIILTSTLPTTQGLPAVLKRLGPTLSASVLGFSFEDLTTKVKRGGQQMPYSVEDYGRLNKSDIVRAHVEWLRPGAWIAVDDDSILWTELERRDHFVYVDPCKGLLDPAAQDRLITVLTGQFGPPSAMSASPRS